MTDSISILATHVANTLPDSLAARKRVLRALQTVIKPSHPAWRDIELQLAAIANLEHLQVTLPLKFNSRHDGNGDGDGGAK
jgi:hypothetical protein